MRKILTSAMMIGVVACGGGDDAQDPDAAAGGADAQVSTADAHLPDAQVSDACPGAGSDTLDSLLPSGGQTMVLVKLSFIDTTSHIAASHAYDFITLVRDMVRVVDQTNLDEVSTRFGATYDPCALQGFVGGDTTMFRSDLMYVLTDFAGAVEDIDEPIAIGDTMYIDNDGDVFVHQGDPAQFDDLPHTQEIDLTLYAGEGTAVTPAAGDVHQLDLKIRETFYHVYARGSLD